MSIFLSVALETEEQTISHDHLDSCCAVAVARLVMIDLCGGKFQALNVHLQLGLHFHCEEHTTTEFHFS
jgi:hypothetical protein